MVAIYYRIVAWFALPIVVPCDSGSRKHSAARRENYGALRNNGRFLDGYVTSGDRIGDVDLRGQRACLASGIP